MTDIKQLQQMSQFSIIRELPGDKGSSNKPSSSVVTTTSDSAKLHNSNNQLQSFTINSNYEHSKKQQQQQQQKQQQQQHQRPAELKFRIEPIGIQPEDDDDLDSCPARTRASWPHQIDPWWKPADRFEKPPYSYATLIAHAILTSKDGRLTLSEIYKWISEEYPYYKRGQKGWQNSIRHNLSLNKKWFIKVDRRPTQANPGKGGYWTLQVNMEKHFVDNLCQAGSHSRRHHDMGIYSNVSNQYYRSSSSSSASGQEGGHSGNMKRFPVNMCPSIHITRPEDFEAKKAAVKERKQSAAAATTSTSRSRNAVTQVKSRMLREATASTSEPSENVNSTTFTTPRTDSKSFIIRFDPSDTADKKRKGKPGSNTKKPSPKAGKRRKYVEPGSSTAEDDDNAVEVEEFGHTSKKRKATTTTTTATTEKATDATCVDLQQQAIDFLTSAGHNNVPFSYSDLLLSAYDGIDALTKPSDVIQVMPSAANEDIASCSALMPFETYNDFWMYEPDQLFLLQQQQQQQAATTNVPTHYAMKTRNTTSTMLLTSEYPPAGAADTPMLYDTEARNILEGLQSAYIPTTTEEQLHQDQKASEKETILMEQPTTVVSQHPCMKTVDLQSVALDKTIHCPDALTLEAFTDPSSSWFVSDFNSYNFEQYVDFGGVADVHASSSNDGVGDIVLTDNNDTILNMYWPEDCFLRIEPENGDHPLSSSLLGKM